MVSIKRYNHIIHWNIFLFSRNSLKTKSKQDYQITSEIVWKSISKKKLSKQNIQDISEVIINFSSLSIFFQDYMCFQKSRAKWQHSMGNCQRLNPRLTTTFASITQPVAIQNTFVMSFLDNFSHWSKLVTKNQSANPTKMNFPTVNHQIKKNAM